MDLIIRADTNIQIGTGHLMRCLALAQAWKDLGGHVIFITSCQKKGLNQHIQKEGFELHLLPYIHPDPRDLDYTKSILARYPDSWIALDGYHFDELYQKQIKDIGYHLLVIDDFAHLKNYYADIVLNQNLNASSLYYSKESFTHMMLGSSYVLLRREFLEWRKRKHNISNIAKHILVTLGGSDPSNHTLRVIQLLQKIDMSNLEALIVIGAINPHIKSLEKVARQSHNKIRIIHNTQNMPELMAHTDMAISLVGTTLWELFFLGVPTLVIEHTNSPMKISKQLEKHKLVKVLHWNANINEKSSINTISFLLKSFNTRAIMSKNGQEIVDGLGAKRVISTMLNKSANCLRLRPAKEEDCYLLWEWANDPKVRKESFSSKFISWRDHTKWFRKKLSDPDCYHYILLGKKELPIGQVRFDTANDEAEISITIAPIYRNRGYGTEGIHIASQRLFQETTIIKIYANIKPNNNASICAFMKAGYTSIGIKKVKRNKSFQMVAKKEEFLS